MVEKLKDQLVETVKNLQAFVAGKTISFPVYMGRESKEMFTGDNPWYTGEKIHHEPDHMECCHNYTDSGAADRFHRQHHYLVERPWQKSLKKIIGHFKHDNSHYNSGPRL